MSEADSIAQTILQGANAQAGFVTRLGDLAAQGKINSAQIWGQALNNIGSSVAAIPQQMQQQKVDALKLQDVQGQIDDRKAQAALASSKAAADAMATARKAGFSAIIQGLSAKGPLNPDEVVQAGNAAGLNDLTDQWQKDYLAQQAQGATLVHQQLTNHVMAMSSASALVQHVQDTPSLQMALQQIDANPALSPDEKAHIHQTLGTTFDPATTPTALATLADEGRTQSEQDAAARAAVEDHLKNVQTSKTVGELRQASITQAAGLLGAAKGPDDYARTLKLVGASDPSIAAMFPQVWSGPQTSDQARTLGMTAEQQTQAQQAATNAAQTARYQAAELALRNKELAQKADTTTRANQDAVAEYMSGLKTGTVKLTDIPAAGGMRDAAAAALRQEGYDLSRPLTAQTQARVEFSKAVLPQIQQVADLAKTIDSWGLMGTVGGRWRDLLSTEGAADSLSGLSDDQKRIVGQFATQSKLLASGMAMAHGGARGGGSFQMVEQMGKLVDPRNKPLSVFLGNLDAAQGVLTGYASLGPMGGGPTGSNVATPNTGGPGAGGGPGGATGGGPVRVKGKDGKTYEFPNQSAADQFKQAGG